jgi:hypothetical protein
MNIQFNGTIITVEVDELESAYELKCVCGHKLSEHGCWIQWNYPDPFHHTMHQSQCTQCRVSDKFECEKFRMK